MAQSRYPRRGHRIAPAVLRELLQVPVQAKYFKGRQGAVMLFCDLDETAWERFGDEVCWELAREVLRRVGRVTRMPVSIGKRRLPPIPHGMTLADLDLEVRTYNCLAREGFGRYPEDLGKHTVADLLSIRTFGAKCLVDLLSSLETLVAREGKVDEKLTADAEALGAMPEAAGIEFSDPRLGSLLRAMDMESNTVGEMVERMIKRRLDPPDPARLREQISEIRAKVQELSGLPLEEELVQIFAPDSSSRDQRIVVEYYGWDGGESHTLEQLGQKYGLSRERIRQVCNRAIKRIRDTVVFAPVLDRSLALLNQRIPMGLEKLQSQLDATRVSRRRLPVEAILQAAKFLSRRPKFVIVQLGPSHLAVSPKQVELLQVILQAVKRVVTTHGATKIADVMAELATRLPKRVDPVLVRESLETRKDFHWLDQRQQWFRLYPLPQYGLPNMIEKVLSVAGQLEVSKLRAAMARCRRRRRELPPVKILLEFCRQMPGVRVEGNTIISDPPRDWRKTLIGVERKLVEVLTEHGPVMERTAFEQRCIQNGMNRFSFNVIVMSSPVIKQYGRSVYGLLGLKVSRKMARKLVSQRPRTAHSRVLRAFGQTDDGRFYLAYRLSRAAISGGVITVPAAMKRHICGRFTLRTPDGRKAGTLVSKEGCGWGLGPVLRGNPAEPGDYMLLLLDKTNRIAQIRIGDESIMQTFSPACPRRENTPRGRGG